MRVTHHRLDLVFAAFVLSILLVAIGYRDVWQRLPRPLPADRFGLAVEEARATAAQLAFLLQLQRERKLTDVYFATMLDHVHEQLVEEIEHDRRAHPAPEIAAAFARYRGFQDSLELATSRLAAPAFDTTQAEAYRLRMLAVEAALRAEALR